MGRDRDGEAGSSGKTTRTCDSVSTGVSSRPSVTRPTTTSLGPSVSGVDTRLGRWSGPRLGRGTDVGVGIGVLVAPPEYRCPPEG